jgi:hypothetical protein
MHGRGARLTRVSQDHSSCQHIVLCLVQIPLIFAGLTFVVGAAIMAGAVHIAMVIVGRLILGLGVGVGTTVSGIHVCMQSLGHASLP